MERMIGNARLELIHGDLTLQAVDAIVNAANSSLLGGGGVDGAIHRAGGPAILAECRAIVAKIGRLPTGQAAITTGGDLPAKHVIHTVGPVWQGGMRGEDEVLAWCYRRSLEVAAGAGVATIAFPSIGTGAYRFPVERASRIAVAAVRGGMAAHPGIATVTLVCFGADVLAAYRTALA